MTKVKQVKHSSLVGFHQANKTSTITIRIQPEHLQEIRNKAFRQGIGPTTLARMWIMEHLNQQSESQ